MKFKKKIRKALKKNNFTLLELLLVVTILGIIAGGLITGFGNAEENSAQSQAARDIAALESAIDGFRTFNGNKLPNNVDTLIAATPGANPGNDAVADTKADGAVVAAAVISKVMNQGKWEDGNGKATVTTLTATQVDNLVAAGITKVRFLDLAGEAGGALAIPTSEGDVSTVGAIENIDIPQHAFLAPRAGTSTRQRGRGYYVDLDALADDAAKVLVPFAVWSGQNTAVPDALYNNTKVGADAKAVLVALGISSVSDIVKADGNFNLRTVPNYANQESQYYSNYIMLVDVSKSPAKFVAIVDSKGDFLAEEHAEATDQKQ